MLKMKARKKIMTSRIAFRLGVFCMTQSYNTLKKAKMDNSLIKKDGPINARLVHSR
jgi:hypothetical protein